MQIRKNSGDINLHHQSSVEQLRSSTALYNDGQRNYTRMQAKRNWDLEDKAKRENSEFANENLIPQGYMHAFATESPSHGKGVQGHEKLFFRTSNSLVDHALRIWEFEDGDAENFEQAATDLAQRELVSIQAHLEANLPEKGNMSQKAMNHIIQRQMKARKLSLENWHDADKRKAFSEISRIGYKYLEPLGTNILSYLRNTDKSSSEYRQAKAIFQCKQMLRAWLNPNYACLASSEEGLSREVLKNATADQALEAWTYMTSIMQGYDDNNTIKIRIKAIQDNLRQETNWFL